MDRREMWDLQDRLEELTEEYAENHGFYGDDGEFTSTWWEDDKKLQEAEEYAYSKLEKERNQADSSELDSPEAIAEDQNALKIRIYQINSERDVDRVAFESLDGMKRYSGRDDVDASIYDKVFDGSVMCSDLEQVYEMFNCNHPSGFVGHSLSMSDVVEVVEVPSIASGDIEEGFYYCDSFGFAKIDFQIQKSLDQVISECSDKQAKQEPTRGGDVANDIDR